MIRFCFRARSDCLCWNSSGWLKVGNDVFGHELLLALNVNGVQTRGVTVADRYGTGVSLMRLTHGNGAGIQMKCETPNVEATLTFAEVDRDILKEVQLFM
jgi:sugar/nucleoside kinase (ribokinase family)